MTVRLTAKGEMKAVAIDPSLLKADEKEILEDLLMAAHNDARAKGEALVQERMGALTGRPADPARHEAAVLSAAHGSFRQPGPRSSG